MEVKQKKRIHLHVMFTVLVLLAASTQTLFATPRLTPDPRLAKADTGHAEMTPEHFARLALIASGADDTSILLHTNRLGELTHTLNTELESISSDRERAEHILTFMYREILTRYVSLQTRFDRALATGEYNCVSSSVLYMYFALNAGLEVWGNETTDHAFCTVRIDGKTIDVETTNPHGFDPGSPKPLSSTRADTSRYLVVPRTTYRNRQRITERRLLSLIYQNRMADLARNKQYKEAAELAVDAYTLERHTRPTNELVNNLLNYPIDLSGRGQHRQALDFAVSLVQHYGNHTKFIDFVHGTAQNAVSQHLQNNEFDEARSFLLANSSHLNPVRFDELFQSVLMHRMNHLYRTAPFDTALAALHQYRAEMDVRTFNQTVSAIFGKEAGQSARSGLWLDAAATVEAGLAIAPDNRELQALRRTFRDNYAIEVHNRFAAEMNRGNRDAARSILEAGLEQVPESRTLQNNLRYFQ